MIKRILSITSVIAASIVIIGYGHIMGWFVPNTPYQSFYDANLKRITEYLPPNTTTESDKIPAVVMAHGCGGPFNHQERWAKNFNDIGVAGFVVDSYSNRDLTPRPVCKGRKFYGHQRSADLVAALDHVAKLPYIDKNQIYLAGWSHGGWTVLDTVALLSHDKPPSNLDQLPEQVDQLQLAGSIIFYPYCGKFSHAKQKEWAGSQSSLMLLVENDHKINEKACITFIDKMVAKGHNIKLETFSGVEHAFDYPAGWSGYT